ncbi:MAG: MGMT family protein [Elusimicrobiota bacterium]
MRFQVLSRRRIYDVVRRIPRGRVATYGQVAWLAGFPRHARQVGYALQALPDDETAPWQRVVNAQGMISPRAHPYGVLQQRELLEREGVAFDANGRIRLARFQWKPRR